jgi:hypothetical protein
MLPRIIKAATGLEKQPALFGHLACSHTETSPWRRSRFRVEWTCAEVRPLQLYISFLIHSGKRIKLL